MREPHLMWWHKRRNVCVCLCVCVTVVLLDINCRCILNIDSNMYMLYILFADAKSEHTNAANAPSQRTFTTHTIHVIRCACAHRKWNEKAPSSLSASLSSVENWRASSSSSFRTLCLCAFALVVCVCECVCLTLVIASDVGWDMTGIHLTYLGKNPFYASKGFDAECF